MKIKKYTIDEDIPKGAVFIESKLEYTEVKAKVGDGGAGAKESKTTYFYFLVEEESGTDKKENDCLHCKYGPSPTNARTNREHTCKLGNPGGNSQGYVGRQ